MSRATLFVGGLIAVIIISFLFVVGLSLHLLSNIDISNIASHTTEEISQVEFQGEVEFITVEVVEIIDGDTIKVLENGEVKTVRLIGIDAPEARSKDCKNKEATQFLSELILNKEVRLEADSTQTDVDRYGRDLRYVFLDDMNINQEIINAGLAQEYTYNKPYKYKDEFWQSQNNAKVQEIGIWSEECKLKTQ